MKICVVCDKELIYPTDAYGAHNEPKCWKCFINDECAEIDVKVQSIEKMIGDFIVLIREAEESHD